MCVVLMSPCPFLIFFLDLSGPSVLLPVNGAQTTAVDDLLRDGMNPYPP